MIPQMDIGAWIALSAFLVSAATLWTGSRRATVDVLSKRIDQLESDVAKCKSECESLRDENRWYVRKLQEAENRLRRRPSGDA